MKLGRLPACEKGQVAGEGGKCFDVMTTGPGGEPKTMREVVLEQDCRRSGDLVKASIRRRSEVMSRRGHDVHVALNAIAAECTARQERLDVCERAGRYAPGSPFAAEQVRQRDALIACRELATLYRSLLAQGVRRAP